MIACIITDAWTLRDGLTFLLTAIAVWIAYQQWLTNELKVQHDLYEQKFAVFTVLIDFLNAVVVKGLQSDDQSLDGVFFSSRREKVISYLRGVKSQIT